MASEKKANSTFCILPWRHLHMGPQGLSSLCCDANEYLFNFGYLDDSNILSGFTSEKMKVARNKMLAGEKIEACSRCYINEEAGIKSARQFYNEKFQKATDEVLRLNSVESNEIISLDLRFDKTCNFMCRTCNPDYSSSIENEQLRLNLIKKKPKPQPPSLKKIISDIDIKKVQRIYFAGGEPLLSVDHYWFLKELVRLNKTDIELVYTTNFSRVKKNEYEIFDLWNQFKSVVVGVSLDAIGARAEYMRKGTDWNQIENDIVLFQRKCPSVYIFASCTISVFNVLSLPDFYSYLVKKSLITKNALHLHMVYEPFEHNINNLGNHFREEAKASLLKLKSLLDKDSRRLHSDIDGIIQYLSGPSGKDLRSDFFNKNSVTDSYRNESLFEIFPELKVLNQA